MSLIIRILGKKDGNGRGNGPLARSPAILYSRWIAGINLPNGRPPRKVTIWLREQSLTHARRPMALMVSWRPGDTPALSWRYRAGRTESQYGCHYQAAARFFFF